MKKFSKEYLTRELKKRLIEQDHAIEAVIPYINTYQAELNNSGRPIGVFLLLGPTGSGKTRTVEALSEVLHGMDKRHFLRIDCGQFELSHEVAKLIGCFVPDTNVLMSDSTPKAIKDVVPGDLVITKNGEPRIVLERKSYEYTGDMIKINVASSNIPIVCTPDHKILAIKLNAENKRVRDPKGLYNPDALTWVHAKDLGKHDIVAYPRNHTEIEPPVLDLLKYIDTDTYEVDGSYIRPYRGKWVKNNIKVNEDFVRLAGYYVAEGGNSNERKSINFTLGVPHKQTIIDDIYKLIPRVFGTDVHIREEDRTAQGSKRLYICSLIIANLFADLFGDHTYKKRVPDWFLHLPEKLLWHFLDAAIMGDGSRVVKRRVDYSTTSPHLAYQIQFILRARLGVTNQIQLHKPEKEGWAGRYRLYVAGAQIVEFAKALPVGGEAIDLIGERYEEGIQRMSHVDDKYVYFRVKKTEVVPYSGPVYDLSVEEQTSYVTQFIVSNSPAGYLGHRETPGMLIQSKLTETLSEDCDISIILFDEIEKAHVNLYKLLLSVMDKGELSMGDNTTTSFKKSLIFFTSNLGAQAMQNVLSQNMGFLAGTRMVAGSVSKKLESIGLLAAKKKFAPEFFNRLDEIITYKSLSEQAIKTIFDMSFSQFRSLLYKKKEPKNLFIMLSDEAEKHLISQGFSELYGARELNRIMQRKLVQPVSNLIIDGKIEDNAVIHVKMVGDGELEFGILSKSEVDKLMGVEA